MTAAFREGHLDVAGERIRYCEAGQGPPLLHVQVAGAPVVTPAHERLAGHFRVLVVAAAAGATTLARLVEALGLDAVHLLASGMSARAALGLALQAPARVRALVLESPGSLDAGLEGRLAGITTPALVLAGTRDGAVAAPARACRAGLPNGHLVFVYDAGPAIGADRPAAFAEVVGDFLERGDAFVISRARTMITP